MLSDKKSILQLVSLMTAHGIQDVVLCPGSRNAPICHTISQLPQFRCHALTDERSAGFFAIGLALATQRTVAVCVTSGSALVNLHPAMAEAYYQQVPLLVISADRPMAWIGQMDGQTMRQPGALQGVTKMSVNLPEVHTDEEAWHCNRLLNEALLECVHRTKGPVHVNVPVSEPLYEFHTEDLPEERVIRRIEGGGPGQEPQLVQLLRGVRKGVIVIGQQTDSTLEDSLRALSSRFVLLAEHLANVAGSALPLSDALMAEVEADRARSEGGAMHLDLVITIGGHVVNKRFKQFLRKHSPRQHWHVSPDGHVADLFGCLTMVVEASVPAFLAALARVTEEDCEGVASAERATFLSWWKEASRKAGLASASLLDSSNLHLQCVGRLMQMIPACAVLHLANSSSVRYAQHFTLSGGRTVCCNRGINGIEGSLSAAVGYATATPDRPNFVVIGDLSFFYDQNALWNRHLPDNLHILLLNSGGGKIFDSLPVPGDERSRSFICASQDYDAHCVAKQFGLRYLEGMSCLEDFVLSRESVLLEVKLVL